MDIHLASEIVWIVAFAFYTFAIILITKQIYDYLVNTKHMNKNVIVYYNLPLSKIDTPVIFKEEKNI